MRIVFSAMLCLLLAGLAYALSVPLTLQGSRTPRLGAFLHPQKGFWQQAEPAKANRQISIAHSGLTQEVEVYVDERLVPHVYAENEHDMYFVQGYLHARYRLWQMEFQTHAAAGRLAEIMGARQGQTDFLRIDRYFRRLGMVYAAEQSLTALESNATTKAVCDAYTAGVNAYISRLSADDYPLEYKLLDYKPEPWTNLKTALFLKYMSFDLAGGEQDFEMTAARSVFTRAQFEKLYPYAKDSLNPIMPALPKWPRGTVFPKKPAVADSAYFMFEGRASLPDTIPQPDAFNGSNNWAVSGSKTKSGFPILANDPHLGLNLPAIWYEMQLSCPQGEAYGASFPGAPCIIIGFNRQTAWGFTNGMRDMRDYYEVKFTDTTKTSYFFQQQTQPSTIRIEKIKVRGGADVDERIAMTHWGPVMYDKDWFADKLNTGKYWACRWIAHDASNELYTFYKLNYGTGYSSYLEAMKGYHCPAQNMVFASTDGDIAIKHNGYLPAKWLRQGDFLMPGDDSSFAWSAPIDDSSNKVLHNPAQGFVSSANQYTYHPAGYPFYMGGTHESDRGNRIHHLLTNAGKVDAEAMMAMQADALDEQARVMLPRMLAKMPLQGLSVQELQWIDSLKQWNFEAHKQSRSMTLYRNWADSLARVIYYDEFALAGNESLRLPGLSTINLMLRTDSNYLFTDDVATTNVREGWAHCLYKSYRQTVAAFIRMPAREQPWGVHKNSSVRHLLKLDALSVLNIGGHGSSRSINAHQGGHGPSWKMVVHLNPAGVEAWGIYPGGQSGNAGSKYYHSFIPTYMDGRHYKLQFLQKAEAQKANGWQRIKFVKAA